jgi:hypothetical protein
MRKREFVGIFVAVGAVTIGVIAYIKGKNNGFMKGYSEADNQRYSESIKSV